uniref:TrmE-type G domain-containing protein n=1 Tax=Anopheles coluzzii TaxID=1518534 RepID=A0A8W7Q3I2_ANOCL
LLSILCNKISRISVVINSPGKMLTARLYGAMFVKQFFYTTLRQTVRNSSTIFGLSSGFGKCGVAVIRVSGSASRAIVDKKTRLKSFPEPRRAVLTKIFHGQTNAMIDRGLLLWFPGPQSFTGEDTIEFHVHGGTAIVSAMYDSLATFPDTRIAEPGEFTKRAFYAGKMDLTEVEGLADLIHAETEAQRKQALRQANGQLSCFYNDLRTQLVQAIASIEAYIDFAEDQDVDDNVLSVAVQNIEGAIGQLKAHLNDNRRGERLRNGVRTAIVGAPNVGKSSLINLLSQRNVSIVTSIAGTTRDISGLPELLERLKTRLVQLCGDPSVESPTISQERHRYHLKQCLACLEQFRDYFHETGAPNRDLAIVTHHLRNAVRCIGKITGTVETEEILDVIFSTFCIGK